MTTTVTLRPTATLRQQSVTVVGTAATVHEALADGSDATYCTNPAGCLGKIQFATATLPVGSIIDSVVLRLRMRRDASPTQLGVDYGRSTMAFAPSTGSFRTDSSAPQNGFSVQSIANGVTLAWNVDVGNVDLAAAYLDVIYLARPTVTVTGPTGTIVGTKPTITWNPTAELGQDRYQVKIFTQAQYTAGGFNATDSAAFYDSGILAGSNEEHTPTVNLTNGGIYRFYVRIAQQSGGALQWSAWSFSSGTVDAAVPNLPGLTVTVDDTQARIKLKITSTYIPPDPGGGGATSYGSGAYGSGPYGGTAGGGAAGAAAAAAEGGWQFVTAQRTSDGTNWENVRSATHAVVYGDTFIVFDYEACNGTPVQYRAQAIADFGDGEVASDWTTPSAPVQWTSSATWLKSPTLPAINTTVNIAEIQTLARRIPQGRFDVAGRTDPVMVSDKRKLYEGTITFNVLEDGELAALMDLFDRSEVLLLQTDEHAGWGCRYIAPGDISEDRVAQTAGRPERLITCPFVEVYAPAGDIVGIGASWQTVLARYATWALVQGANTSWASVKALTG